MIGQWSQKKGTEFNREILDAIEELNDYSTEVWVLMNRTTEEDLPGIGNTIGVE